MCTKLQGVKGEKKRVVCIIIFSLVAVATGDDNQIIGSFDLRKTSFAKNLL